MVYEGLAVGFAAFAITILFQPLILKAERRFSREIWPFFLLAGLAGLAAAALARSLLISSALGAFGFSALWSIQELFRLRKSELPGLKLSGRALGEGAFDLLYLAAMLTLSLLLLRQEKRLYGLACMVLFIGDACHLLPRIYAFSHGGAARFSTSVGIGKFITSVTMSAFYYLLAPGSGMLILLCARVVLCVLPTNKWTGQAAPGIGFARNIPLLAMGALAAYSLGFPYALAIAVSFLFYAPVVLLAHKRPKFGMLMLPKSCAYIALALLLLYMP
jgi:hypothetical protein